MVLVFLTPALIASPNCRKELRVLGAAWRRWHALDFDSELEIGEYDRECNRRTPPLPLFVCSGWDREQEEKEGDEGGVEGGGGHAMARRAVIDLLSEVRGLDVDGCVAMRGRWKAGAERNEVVQEQEQGKMKMKTLGPLSLYEHILVLLPDAESLNAAGTETGTGAGAGARAYNCIVEAGGSNLFPSKRHAHSNVHAHGVTSLSRNTLVDHAILLGEVIERLGSWLGAGNADIYAQGTLQCNTPAPCDDLGVPLRRQHRDESRWPSPSDLLQCNTYAIHRDAGLAISSASETDVDGGRSQGQGQGDGGASSLCVAAAAI